MSRPLIFITGATGFIALLKACCNLDFIVVPDFVSPGVFDKALQDVTYVFHLASPMPGKGSDFESDYVNPAVEGTIALLNAAKKAKTIKRVVIVSSLLALIPLDALVTGKFTAKEGMNPSIPVDPKMSFPEDPMSSGGLKYHASKILAHRATLEWVSAYSPPFNVITLHPSFVFGRNLAQSSPEALEGTNAMLWGSLHSPKPFIPMSAVDVVDVAAAHLKSLDIEVGEKNEAEEFILCANEGDGWTWGNVAEFVKAKYPQIKVGLKGPFDDPPKVDTQRAEQLLGINWKPMKDTISEFLDHQIELEAQL